MSKSTLICEEFRAGFELEGRNFILGPVSGRKSNSEKISRIQSMALMLYLQGSDVRLNGIF